MAWHSEQLLVRSGQFQLPAQVMNMIYNELIKEIGSEMSRLSRQALQPPCTANDLEKLKQTSLRDLGYGIPAEYACFLADTNGLVWNGLSIYGSKSMPLNGLPDYSVEGFVDANRHYRSLRRGDPMQDYIVFGEDSVVFFAYHIPPGVYEVITIVGMTALETYMSFDELLIDALRGHV